MMTIDVLFVQLVQTGVLTMRCNPEVALHLVSAANNAVSRIPSDRDIADSALEFVVDAMLKDGWWGSPVWSQFSEATNDTAAVDEEDDSQESDSIEEEA